MKDPISLADRWLIHTLEKGTHAFQRRFHKTNFWLAKWLATFEAFFIFYGVLLKNREGSLVLLDYIGIPIFFVVAFFFANYYWRVEEHKGFVRLARNEANPRKKSIEWMLVRLFFLISPIFSIIGILLPNLQQIFKVSPSVWVTLLILAIMLLVSAVLLILSSAFFYLIACDPLLPSKEKERNTTPVPQLAQ